MTQLSAVCACSPAVSTSGGAGSEYVETSLPSTSYCGTCGNRREAGLSSRVIHNYVPHCKQHFSWDCGLACVLMILKAAGPHLCDYQTLRRMCPTTSIWTVDLAHLMRRFGLEVLFFTITLGPNPAYVNESFYMEHMQEDERRVSHLFMTASAAGIAIQQRSVTSDELSDLILRRECLVIALVDKRKLDPWLMAADMCLPTLCGMDLGYTGHYILIVGFDAAQQEFIVRDPATSSPEHRVSVSALEQARRSFGTDEDLLVIPCRSVFALRQACQPATATAPVTAGLVSPVKTAVCT